MTERKDEKYVRTYGKGRKKRGQSRSERARRRAPSLVPILIAYMIRGAALLLVAEFQSGRLIIKPRYCTE